MKHLSVFMCCLALVLALAGASLAENDPDWSGLAVSSGTLIGVRYTNSGDEYGSTYSAEIGWTEDGTLALTIEVSPTFDQPVTVTRYSAADDTLCRVADLVNANGMLSWAGREDGLLVLDAAHPYLILQVLTEDGDRIDYQISGYIEFTDEEAEAYWGAVAIVEESMTEERLLEAYQKE